MSEIFFSFCTTLSFGKFCLLWNTVIDKNENRVGGIKSLLLIVYRKWEHVKLVEKVEKVVADTQSYT